MTFPGKRASQLKSNVPSHKTLIAEPEQSVDFENTRNVFIEGDNLDVLRLLQKSYRGKVKVIYIDPPYNTGNDGFTYNDTFSEPENQYLRDIGALDENGVRQISELQDGLKGRFHAGWLNMMYPRLKLARELLTDDGVIFISIDDNEQANLKLLCDEIFGEDNFVSNIIWQRASGGGNSGDVVTGHDFVLLYKKNKKMKFYGDESSRGKLMKMDGKPIRIDDDVVRKVFGKYERGIERRCYYEELSEYRSQEQIDEIQDKIDKGEYVLLRQNNGKHFIGQVIEQGKRKILYSIIQGVLNSQGNEDLAELGIAFSNPKPVELVKYLINSSLPENSLVMDFFAGSATTAHAVMKLNAEDSTLRNRFLMVQRPEAIDPKKSKKEHEFCREELNSEPLISEIAKERVRRAGEKISNDNPELEMDTGFRAFRVIDSVVIRDDEKKLTDTKQGELLRYATALKREDFDGLIYEAILHTGVMLDEQLHKEEIGDGNYPIALGARRCYCVTEGLTQEIVQEIIDRYGDAFDALFYLSDCPAPTVSYAEIEAAIKLAGGDKSVEILNFY